MLSDIVRELIAQVDKERLRRTIFALSKYPLPHRKLNARLPGHEKSTLEEADDLLACELQSWGYSVERQAVPVQAFRCDESKPKAQQYSPPLPDDPWYTAHNLYAERPGADAPDEIVLVLAHKDSQSWVDSPGAYDNAVGTAGVLEIARVLKGFTGRRTLRFLFCNEEHVPWTSVAAAERSRQRGENLIAIFNVDGIGGKSQEEAEAGHKPNVTLYTAPEGEAVAALMAEINETYAIGLEQRSCPRPSPGDDDGSFVKAGYPASVAITGSWPYADPNYHCESDVPEAVDLENVRMAVQAILAAAVVRATESVVREDEIIQQE